MRYLVLSVPTWVRIPLLAYTAPWRNLVQRDRLRTCSHRGKMPVQIRSVPFNCRRSLIWLRQAVCKINSKIPLDFGSNPNVGFLIQWTNSKSFGCNPKNCQCKSDLYLMPEIEATACFACLLSAWNRSQDLKPSQDWRTGVLRGVWVQIPPQAFWERNSMVEYLTCINTRYQVAEGSNPSVSILFHNIY